MKIFVALAIAALAFTPSATAESETIRQAVNLTELERNALFAGIVDSTKDHTCSKVTHSILRGVDDEGNLYVTVRCSDGGDYQLQLSDTRSGVLECSIVEGMFEIDCWKPFLPMEPASPASS